jgi:hypothetical protein
VKGHPFFVHPGIADTVFADEVEDLFTDHYLV